LDDQIGGWPILNPNWNASNFDLFKALAKLRAYGDEPFFSLSVDQDMEKPSDNLIFITEPETFATKDVLLSDAGKMYTDSYEEYLFNVTSLLLKESGDQQDVGKVSSELMDMMDLGRYISLVRISLYYFCLSSLPIFNAPYNCTHYRYFFSSGWSDSCPETRPSRAQEQDFPWIQSAEDLHSLRYFP
jgi:hypothetical protein